jgi:hypothetical protein
VLYAEKEDSLSWLWSVNVCWFREMPEMQAELSPHGGASATHEHDFDGCRKAFDEGKEASEDWKKDFKMVDS